MKKVICITVLLVFSFTGVFAQFSLPKLTYSYNALEPYIDAQTMEIHYNNHHNAYVNNLNKALETATVEIKSLDIISLMNISELPEALKTVVRNNGGGHYNHSLFWSILAPEGSSKLSGKLLKDIEITFGSVEAFKKAFEAAALGRFGSGWAWLYVDAQGKLKIGSTPNQDNPLMDVAEIKGTPILGLDVWEHAYYLKYQSKRASYVSNFWNVVNWNTVSELYRQAIER